MTNNKEITKEVRFTENGPVLVEKCQISDIKFEMPTEYEIPTVFKDTIIFALNKRIQHCIKDLEENSDRMINYNTSSIEYVRKDGTYNCYNKITIVAMQEAVKLAENNNWEAFTANQWEQLAKSLYWVKPMNKERFTFANLISYVLDKFADEVAQLATK